MRLCLQVGNTYLIARGQLKVANKKFSTLNNPYEITLTYDTQIQLCADEPPSKPKTHYRFCTVADIASRPKDAVVDVIGVVSNVSAATSLTSQRTGKELIKRTLELADDSGKAIEITLWGAVASSFPDLDASSNEVVAFKGMRVSEWNTRSLGAGHSTVFEVSPELEVTTRLKEWWEGGGNASIESLSMDTRGGAGSGAQRDESARHTTAEFAALGDGLQGGAEPVYASIRGYFSKLMLGGQQGQEERPMWYGACPKCNKKVVGDEGTGFSCENCGWSGAEATYRYILTLMAVDSTGNTFVTAFNDLAAQILGMKADELKRLKTNDTPAYEAVIANATWKRNLLRVRGKMETYNGNTRMKSHVLSATPVKFAEEGKLLLADIAKYGDLEPATPTPVETPVA